MGNEIERKFLVKSNDWEELVTQSNAFAQGYLSTSAKATVRVRVIDDQDAVVTLKGKPVGLVRQEYEYAVPLQDGLELLEMSRPNVVEKVRHLVPIGSVTWEIDVFSGGHEGLVLAEVELEHENQEVEIPPWIGKEVTDDDRYANASLSRAPGVPTLSYA